MRKSFTLIEIIVVISILLISLGFGLVQYNTYTEQTKLKSATKKLVDVLELAKKKAFSSDLFNQSCTNFNGYRVVLGTNSYSLRFGCNGVYTTIIKTYNFPTNITATQGIGTFTFPRLGLGTNITNNTITLKNSSTNKCQNISISSIGIVDVDETLINCP